MRRCPHCGFLNFDISVICGRCERDLGNAPSIKNDATSVNTDDASPTQTQPIRKKPKISAIPKQEDKVQPATQTPQAGASNHVHSAQTQGSGATPNNGSATQRPRQKADHGLQPPLPVSFDSANSSSNNKFPPQQKTHRPETAMKAAATTPAQANNIELSEENLFETPKSEAKLEYHNGEQPLVEIQATKRYQLPSSKAYIYSYMLDMLFIFALGGTVFTIRLLNSSSATIDGGGSNFSGFDFVFDHIWAHSGVYVSSFFILIGLALAYQIITLNVIGQTFGQRLCKISIFDSIQQQKPPLQKIIIRSTLSLFGMLLFGLGHLWKIVDHYKRGLHDIISKTVIIKTPTK